MKKKRKLLLLLLVILLNSLVSLTAFGIGEHDHEWKERIITYTTTIGSATKCQKINTYRIKYCDICLIEDSRELISTRYTKHDTSEYYVGHDDDWIYFEERCDVCGITIKEYKVRNTGVLPNKLDISF